MIAVIALYFITATCYYNCFIRALDFLLQAAFSKLDSRYLISDLTVKYYLNYLSFIARLLFLIYHLLLILPIKPPYFGHLYYQSIAVPITTPYLDPFNCQSIIFNIIITIPNFELFLPTRQLKDHHALDLRIFLRERDLN